MHGQSKRRSAAGRVLLAWLAAAAWLPGATGVAAESGLTTIGSPRENRTLGSGHLGVTGTYAASDQRDVAVVYVIDVSASTAERVGDCSGDGQVTGVDDANGDGAAGTALDCEITALAGLATQVATVAPGASTAVVAFGSTAAVADVDSADGFPEAQRVVSAGYDGPDGTETRGPLGGERDHVPDVVNVLSSVRVGRVPIFTAQSVGRGRSFTDAVAAVNGVFGLGELAGRRKVVLFVSNGEAPLDPGDPDLAAVHAAGTVYAYGLGPQAGCAPGSALALVAGDPGRCTLVDDPATLALRVGTTPEAVGVQVRSGGSVAASAQAPVSVVGSWSATFDGLAPGPYEIVAAGPLGPPAVRRVTLVDPAGRLRYVALGDSYSSGEGEGPWRSQIPSEPLSDRFDEACHRSPRGYPMQVRAGPGGPVIARAPGSAELFTFAACAGATTKNVLSQEQYAGMGRQLDELGPDVDLVTLTIGGNDVEFPQVVVHCVTQLHCMNDGFVRFNSGASLTLAQYVDARLALLAAQLPPTYRAIRDATGGRAQVIVAGYPDLFHPNPSLLCTSRIGIEGDERRFLLAASAKFDAVIKAAASKAGVDFVSVRDDFRDHLPCGPRSPEYVRPLTSFGSGALHPTAAGYARYAELVSRAVRPRFAAAAVRPAPGRVPAGALGGVPVDGAGVRADGGVQFASWIGDAVGTVPPLRAADAEALLRTDLASEARLSAPGAQGRGCAALPSGQAVSGAAMGFAPGSTVTVRVSGPNRRGLSAVEVPTDRTGLARFSFVPAGRGPAVQVELEGVDREGLTHRAWAGC